VTPEGARWGLVAEDLNGLAAAEPDIRVVNGTSLIRIGETDAVIARHIGKGWTIFLNVLLDKYPKSRAANFGGANYRTLVNALLDRAGVRPEVQVVSTDGRRLDQAQVARYRFGDSEILTILKDNLAVAGIVGRDGVTVYNDAVLGQVARQEISIKLPRKVYVTDVRAGKRLGYTDVVQSSVLVGDAVVLGLSSTENELTLRGPSTAARGEHPAFSISSSVPGRRVIRCHVFGPDGSMLPLYASNLLLDTLAVDFVLPSALNDPVGTYVIRATDVVTGATGETKITLK
jgi:hypothetical protein